MKKTVTVLVFVILLIFSIFADDSVKKVKVTRHEPTAFLLDAGAMLNMPISSDDNGIGLFVAGTITPVKIWRISAGFKGEFSAFASKEILHAEGGRLGLINAQMMALLVANYPLAKSFEVYAGGGAFYTIKNIEDLNNFGQIWGFSLQGGGRGRANDWFGVGLELNFLFNADTTRTVDAKAYISFEL